MNPLLAALFAAPLLAPNLAPAGGDPGGDSHIEMLPEQLAIPAGVRSRVVTVRNGGTHPMDVRLTPRAWEQLPNGEAKLTTTDALTALPAALTLQPGESRQVKISPTRPVGTVEQAFRIHVEEVDPKGQPLGEASSSLPVFIQPPVPRAAAVIRAAHIAYQTVSFSLANVGSSHFVTTKTEVVAFDAAGARVFSTTLPAAFVLADGSRFFGTDLPPAVCRATRVEVFVDTPGARVTETLGRPNCSE